MKRILFALIGSVCLVSADMGTCQKNCGIDYGKCLILKGDMATCVQEEAACALDCLKGLKMIHRDGKSSPRTENLDSCQLSCAYDHGKCLIQNFDMSFCVEDTTQCAKNCLNGVEFKAKWEEPNVPYFVENGDQGVCQKNCGIDLGKCIILTGNVP